MRSLALALLATLAAVSGHAQAFPSGPSPADDKSFAKLRGITFFFIDVSTSESRPEDADLRGEIRDAMELEMRRANIVPRSVDGLTPETTTPLLTIEAAKLCVLNALANAKVALGSLDQVVRVVMVNGFVNGVDGFSDSPKVLNGASEFLLQVFGDAGKHARAAVSVNGLPLGVSVEVQLVLEVRD